MEPIDEVQSHILGVIASLMRSYNLKTNQVEARYHYVTSLNQNEVTPFYVESTSPVKSEDSEEEVNNITPITSTKSWADYEDEDDDDDDDDDDSIEVNLSPMDVDNESDGLAEEEETKDDSPLYVSTRRQFCSTMQQGIKICPRYSTCTNKFCNHFHVRDEHICPHITRGSYCDTEGCEMIVIRACRKGKRCNDPDCSFRHK